MRVNSRSPGGRAVDDPPQQPTAKPSLPTHGTQVKAGLSRPPTTTTTTATASMGRRLASLPTELLVDIAAYVPKEAHVLFSPRAQLASSVLYGQGQAGESGTLNFNPLARQQLEALVRQPGPLSTRDLDLLCAAAAQLTAPAHVQLRLEVVDKIAETLTQATDEDRLAAVDKLLQAGSALSTPGRSIVDRGDTALTVDDCVNVAFALKVSQVLSKLPDLPKDTDARVKAFAGAVKTFAHDAAMHGFSALNSKGSGPRNASTWIGKGLTEWRDLETRLVKPMALAMEQPGFPIFDIVATNPFRSGQIGSGWVLGVLGEMQTRARARLGELASDPGHPVWDRLLPRSVASDGFDDWPQLTSQLDAMVNAYSGHSSRQESLASGFLDAVRKGSTEGLVYEPVLDAIAAAVRAGTFTVSAPSLQDALATRAGQRFIASAATNPEQFLSVGELLADVKHSKDGVEHCCKLLKDALLSPETSRKARVNFLKSAVAAEKQHLGSDECAMMRRSEWRPLIAEVVYHFEKHDECPVQDLGLDVRTTKLLNAYLSHQRSLVRQAAETNR